MATRGGQTPKPLLMQNALQNLLIVLHVLFGCDNCCSSFGHLFANVSTGFSSFGVQKYVIDSEHQMNVEYAEIFIWNRGANLSDFWYVSINTKTCIPNFCALIVFLRG